MMSDHALRVRAVYALRTRYDAPFEQIARVLGLTLARTHELYQWYLADAVWSRGSGGTLDSPASTHHEPE